MPQRTRPPPLQTINKRIEELFYPLIDEGKIILNQIKRLKRWEYRKVLVERYINRKKWSEIVRDFFEFEDDFEEQKDQKYKDKVLDWNKAALKQLEEISAKPYIPIDIETQIHLFCIERK